jgi:hypothetical protein
MSKVETVNSALTFDNLSLASALSTTTPVSTFPPFTASDFHCFDFGISFACLWSRKQKMLITLVAERWRPLTRMLILQLLSYLLIVSNAHRAVAQTRIAEPAGSEPAPTFVAGFVGGRVHNNDLRHSEVQLARRLQARYGNNVEVRVFKNRDRASAHKAIVDWLNGLEIRAERTQGKPEPRIILFGHSWGGSAVVYLAREIRAGRHSCQADSAS